MIQNRFWFVSFCFALGIASSCKTRSFNSSGLGPNYEVENRSDDGAQVEAIPHAAPAADGSFMYHGHKNYVIKQNGREYFKTDWATISIFPQPESDPEADKAEAAKVCAFAATKETKKLCEYVAVRENHLNIMAKVVDDKAGCDSAEHPDHKACSEELDKFQWCSNSRGWRGANCDTCASVQSQSIVSAGAAPITTTMGTLNLVQKLQSVGWKASIPLGGNGPERSDVNCKGMRPGDVAFAKMLSAKDIAEGYGHWPAHAFMFYRWVGPLPTDTFDWNSVSSSRRALVIDNVRKWDALSKVTESESNNRLQNDTARIEHVNGKLAVHDIYKHRRPIFFYDEVNDFNDCWFYMRGPNKL